LDFKILAKISNVKLIFHAKFKSSVARLLTSSALYQTADVKSQWKKIVAQRINPITQLAQFEALKQKITTSA